MQGGLISEFIAVKLVKQQFIFLTQEKAGFARLHPFAIRPQCHAPSYHNASRYLTSFCTSSVPREATYSSFYIISGNGILGKLAKNVGYQSAAITDILNTTNILTFVFRENSAPLGCEGRREAQ